MLQVSELRELRVSPRLTRHAQIVHGHENEYVPASVMKKWTLPRPFIIRPNILGNQ